MDTLTQPAWAVETTDTVRTAAPRFTVMTPTYNRAHTLARVHASLCDQAGRDFEWLVVDDGSTDDTAARVAAWAETSDFPVRYVHQTNQHKKAAFNHGVREARGEWLVALDSDDSLAPWALARMRTAIGQLPVDMAECFVGVIGLCERPDGRVVGERFPADPLDATPQALTFQYRVGGEKFGCLRTAVLRRFPFPEHIAGFVPESLVWRAIARVGYRTRFVNEVFRVYHDSPDALSHQGQDGARHAPGLWLLAHDMLANDLRWLRHHPAAFMMAAVRHVRFGLHLRRAGEPLPLRPDERATLPWLARLLTVLAWPAGWLLYQRDLRRASSRTAAPGANG